MALSIAIFGLVLVTVASVARDFWLKKKEIELNDRIEGWDHEHKVLQEELALRQQAFAEKQYADAIAERDRLVSLPYGDDLAAINDPMFDQTRSPDVF